MGDLPHYFEEYMEQKFKSVDEQFCDIKSKLDTALDNHDQEINELRNEVKWLNQKVWMAIGALIIISAVGGVFVAYFKQLNEVSINKAVKQALLDNDKIKALLDNYDQIIIKNH